MESLAGTRVIIVDNDLKEVGPLVDALSRRQIATCWFTGHPDGLPAPQNRLRHVRLAFLDIDLQGGGVSDHSKVSQLVNVLSNLLATESVGYGVVLWTKHAEELDDFVDTLVKSQAPLPLFVTTIPKSECQKADGEYDLGRIEKRLKKCLSDSLPWRIMWQWEMNAIRASGHMVNDLAVASKPPATPTTQELKRWQKSWGNSLSAVLLNLAQEEFGKDNIQSGQDIVRGAYSAMAPLHADSMEGLAAHPSASLRGAGRAIFNRARALTLPSGLVGKINEKLALTEPTHKAALSGNIYLSRSKGLRKLFSSLPDKKRIVFDLTKGLNATEAMVTSAQLVLVEISPVCDYSNDNVRQCRLLAGVVIPSANFNPKRFDKHAAYLWDFGPYSNEGNDWNLLLDFRQLHSCTPTALGRIMPAYKLRQQVLSHLQSRFAAHATRIGVLRMH